MRAEPVVLWDVNRLLLAYIISPQDETVVTESDMYDFF
jgi:hypothetical protein